MRYTRQGPRWWCAWVPLLGLGGLLILESQAPLSPAGHRVAQLIMTLLMYGVVMGWLRRNHGALVHEAYEREQAQEYTREARQLRRASVRSDDASWDDAWLPWQSNGHDTEMQRRR